METKFLLLIAFSVLSACTEAPEPSYPWLLNTEEAYCVGKDTVDFEVWLDTLKHRVYADCMDGQHPYRALARELSREHYHFRMDSLIKWVPKYCEDSLFFGMQMHSRGGLFAGEERFKGFDYLGLALRPTEDTVLYFYKIPHIHLMNYLPTAEKKKYADYRYGDRNFKRRIDDKSLIYSIKHTYYVRVLSRILQDNPAFHGRGNQARVGTLILASLNYKSTGSIMEFSAMKNNKWDTGPYTVAWIDLSTRSKFSMDNKNAHNFLRKEKMDSMLFVRDFLDKQQVDFLYYSRNDNYGFSEMITISLFPLSTYSFFLGIQLDYKLVEGHEIPFIKDCLLFCPRVLCSDW